MMNVHIHGLVGWMVLGMGAMTLAGCQSRPWAGGDFMPTVEPQIAGLTPVIAQAQVLNRQARGQVRQMTPANVPAQKPGVLATLAVQQRALYQAAATVAVVRTAASREDRAVKQAVVAARHSAQELTATRGLLEQSQRRYHNAWLGGKSHRLIDWIVGLSLAVVALDFLADAFLGVGFNPLEWIAGLSRLAKGKLV